MSQMPDKIWLHKDTKYSTADTVCGYQYDFVQGIEDEGGIENFVEYVPKNMFIDKACECLKTNFAELYLHYMRGTSEDEIVDEFREYLKKAMENEV